MSDSNAYLSSASSNEIFDTLYSSSWEEMEVAITKEKPVVSLEDFGEDWQKRNFSPAVFRFRLEQKMPVA